MTNWTLPKAAQLYKKTHACNRQALPEQAQFCEKNTLLQQAGFAGAGAASRKNTRLLQTPFAGAARPCWKIFALHQGPPCRKAEGGASPALLQRLLISCRKAFLPSQAGKSVISTFEHAALSRGCGGIAFAPAAPEYQLQKRRAPQAKGMWALLNASCVKIPRQNCCFLLTHRLYRPFSMLRVATMSAPVPSTLGTTTCPAFTGASSRTSSRRRTASNSRPLGIGALVFTGRRR